MNASSLRSCSNMKCTAYVPENMAEGKLKQIGFGAQS